MLHLLVEFVVCTYETKAVPKRGGMTCVVVEHHLSLQKRAAAQWSAG